jgi:nucleoside-diphosphate-sugar epimerase
MIRRYSNRKRVLVTGAAEFLGSHLCERLTDDPASSRPTEIAERAKARRWESAGRESLASEAMLDSLLTSQQSAEVRAFKVFR